MTLARIIPIVTGLIAIVGAIIGVAVHITKLQSQIQQARLEDQLNRLKEKYSELEADYQSLLRAGTAAYTKKREIQAELSTISAAVDASASSILVPAPSAIADEEPAELVFLVLTGPAAPKLQGTRVPMSSVAGSVFVTKKPRITHTPRQESSFSDKADEVSKFSTDELLAIPLMCQEKCIGVAEFLNKKDGQLFDADDEQFADRLAMSLAAKVGELIQDPNHVSLLGVTPKRKAEEATILFSDLSNSSILSKSMDASVVIDLLNEYFETLCGIGLDYGATIDKFVGDGFILTFNVPRGLAQHETKAIAAALEMQKRFNELKQKWTVLQYPGVSNIYNRLGITCGPVHRAEMGHSQYRHITVIGDTVNVASKLCEIGDRSRNIIVIGEDLYRRVSSQVVVRELRAEKLREAKSPISAAYEVVSGKE